MSRRPGSLRGQLTTVLIGIGILSTLVLATTVFVILQDTLQQRAEGQLASIRDDRTAAVERVLDELASATSAIAADPGVVAAFGELATSWETLGPDPTAAERAELASFLADDVEELPSALDVPRPDPTAMVGGSVPGRRVQELYVAENPHPPGERDRLDDAGDGSAWTTAHATHHPFLRTLLDATIGSDLLFVSSDSFEVIYSVAKHADLGTDLEDGPWQDTGLAAAATRLPQLASGDTAIVDASFHLPAGSSPTMFFASTVRAGSQVLGALVLQVPIQGLTDFVTASGDWDLLGLGDTGQVVVIGGDGTLRTEPRGWREDPDGWLARLAATGPDGAEESEIVAATGSPVLVQSLANDALEAAADGEDVVVPGVDQWGVPALSAASRVDVTGLDWVLITEQARSETRASVGRLLRTGLLLLILVPVITVVGLLMSRSLTRPHEPVIEASASLATGNVDIDLPDLGSNELGDLARQLEGVAEEIRIRRRAIAEEDRRIEELLSAVVPARLAERVRAGERAHADVLETATVVVVTVVGLPEITSVGEDGVLACTDRIARVLEEAALTNGLERATVGSDQELFLAGYGRPGSRAGDAARFGIAVPGLVRAAGQEFGLAVDARVGMAAGEVGAGLLGTNQLTFAVWGGPAARAATLDSLAAPGEVLVDPAVAAELTEAQDWRLERYDAIGLDEEPVEAWIVTAAAGEAAPTAATEA
jgi:class 3 adenylate cyclase